MRRKPLWITGVVSLIAVIVVSVFFVRVPLAAHADSDSVTVTARTIPNTFNGTYTSTSSINNLNNVVGTADIAIGDAHAFFWHVGDSQLLDITPDGAAWANAGIINNANQIIGYIDSSFFPSGNVEWTSPTKDAAIPIVFPPDTSNDYVRGMNDSGLVVGTMTDASGTQMGVIWANGVSIQPTPLQSLPGATGCDIAGINNLAEIVGSCNFDTAPYNASTYWASPDAMPSILPPLVPGGSEGVSAINNLGHSVGIGSVSDIQGHATMWLSPTMTPADLGPALPPDERCSDCGLASGVNNLDHAVGIAATVGAALFESGAVIGLPMPDDCATGGWAFGINDNDLAVGDMSSCGLAILWTINGSLPTPTPTPTAIPPTPTPIPTQLTALAPANVWVGLKNSDDVGIHFDLRAEVYVNGTQVTSGEVHGVAGGSSGFNNARLDSIPFDAFAPVTFAPGSTLSLKLYVRNACTGPTHNAGTAKLWFNDSAANSNVGATVGGTSSTYYPVNGSLLSITTGVGPKNTIDVAAGAPCSAYKLIGTWAITQ